MSRRRRVEGEPRVGRKGLLVRAWRIIRAPLFSEKQPLIEAEILSDLFRSAYWHKHLRRVKGSEESRTAGLEKQNAKGSELKGSQVERPHLDFHPPIHSSTVQYSISTLPDFPFPPPSSMFSMAAEHIQLLLRYFRIPPPQLRLRFSLHPPPP